MSKSRKIFPFKEIEGKWKDIENKRMDESIEKLMDKMSNFLDVEEKINFGIFIEIISIVKNKLDLLAFLEKKNFSTEKIKEISDLANSVVYINSMLPYTSGKLHSGHGRNFWFTDVIVRFLILSGKNVLSFLGKDAQGLPADLAAQQYGIHPKDWTEKNIIEMNKALDSFAICISRKDDMSTHKNDYHLNQQELFKILYKAGYIKLIERIANYDPVAKTVISNEEVSEDGICSRTGSPVEYIMQKEWALDIVKEADFLLDNQCNWPEKILKMQKAWIGKKYGYLIPFYCHELKKTIEVFTTRPETIYGVTFLVVNPKSPIALELGINKFENNKQIATCDNIYSNKNIPVFLADYVIHDYGTGVVMGCPSCDKRDAAFAKKNNLEFIDVISGEGEEAILINSEHLTGKKISEAVEIITKDLTKGSFLRLKEWGFSRQRYFGCLIPVIDCEKCGILLSDDFVELPYDQSRLKSDEFINVICYKCNNLAKRCTDTMDTFFDSAWYYIYYLLKDEKKVNIIKDLHKALPMDIYIGGAEHANGHLIKTRAFWHILEKLGYIKSKEPILTLINQGMVLHPSYRDENRKYYYPSEIIKKDDKVFSPEGKELIVNNSEKMSKSLKNVIEPTVLFDVFGIDATRFSMMDGVAIDKDIIFEEDKVRTGFDFVNKIYSLSEIIKEYESDSTINWDSSLFFYNITKSLEKFQVHTFTNYLKNFVNLLEEKIKKNLISVSSLKDNYLKLITCIWVICPFLADEILEKFGLKIEDRIWYYGKKPITSRKITIYLNNEKKLTFNWLSNDLDDMLKQALTLIDFKYDRYYITKTGINFIKETLK